MFHNLVHVQVSLEADFIPDCTDYESHFNSVTRFWSLCCYDL